MLLHTKVKNKTENTEHTITVLETGVQPFAILSLFLYLYCRSPFHYPFKELHSSR